MWYKTRLVKVVDVNCARVLATGIDDAWRVMPRSRDRALAHQTIRFP